VKASIKKRISDVWSFDEVNEIRRKLLLGAAALIAITLPAALGFAQARNETPDWQKAAGGKMEFEVASIKLAEPGKRIESNLALNIDNEPIPPGGRLVVQGNLSDLILFAYKLMPTREQEQIMLLHLPKWVANDNFVIEAKAAGNPTKDQMRIMMQALLADRFKVALHFETQEAPVMALVLDKPGKIGPRLRPHADGLPCDAKWTPPPDSGSPSVAPGGFMPTCGPIQAIGGPNRTVLLGARDVTIQNFADYVGILPPASDFGRPIVDETGLKGTFDFSLNWMHVRSGSSAAGTEAQLDEGGPSFEDALKDQLGLKLKPTKAAIQVLIIDHVERPSEN
jgi:bla regulator protein BlaR1